jgi:hypothetical protein
MKAWRVASLCSVVVSLSWTIPANSQTMGLYDDFSSGAIDRVRWAGYQYNVGPSENADFYGENDWGGGLEFRPIDGASTRRAVGGQVQIALVSEEGPAGKARNGLRINHPALLDHVPRIRSLQATVIIADVSVPASIPGCTRTTFGRAGAHIFGHFGNDNVDNFDGGLTGDIFASLALVRRVERAPGVPASVRNVVEITTGRCNNSDCRYVDFGAPHVLSFAWQPGIPYVLTIAWNAQPAPGAFTFTAAGGGDSESHTVATTIVERAHAHAFDLRVENQPVSCRNSNNTDSFTGRVSIDARFDDVRINANAADAAR